LTRGPSAVAVPGRLSAMREQRWPVDEGRAALSLALAAKPVLARDSVGCV